MKNRKIVIALGGNALIKKGQEGTIKEQIDNATTALEGILGIIKNNKVILTHGNGPTVGFNLIRVEAGVEKKAPYTPLGICVADSQGEIGYIIELCLENLFKKHKINKKIVTMVTQVLVDRTDPSLTNPTKFIGPFYTKEEAQKLMNERKDWIAKEDSGRGYRRVVPSPFPLKVIEKKVIKELFDREYTVIAAGGGGIPVIYRDDGTIKGIPAVIDKDLASYVVAKDIGAKTLMILTAVDKVCLNYNTTKQKPLDKMTLKDAKKYFKQGQFPPGNMGPKIEAAIKFLEDGGKEVIICSLEKAKAAFEGKAGTRITNS